MRLYAEGEKFQDEVAAKRGEDEWDLFEPGRIEIRRGRSGGRAIVPGEDRRTNFSPTDEIW